MNLKKIICVIAAGLNLEFFISSSVMANPVDDDSSLSEVSSSLFEEDKNSSSRSLIQKKEIPVQRQFLSKVPNFLPLRNGNNILPPKPPACAEDRPFLKHRNIKNPKDLFFENLYCSNCKKFIGKEVICPKCDLAGKTSFQKIIDSMECCPCCKKFGVLYKYKRGEYRGYRCGSCKSKLRLKIEECNNGKIIEVFENSKLTQGMLQQIFEIGKPLSEEEKTERIEEWKKGDTAISYYPHPFCYDEN